MAKLVIEGYKYSKMSMTTKKLTNDSNVCPER